MWSQLVVLLLGHYGLLIGEKGHLIPIKLGGWPIIAP